MKPFSLAQIPRGCWSPCSWPAARVGAARRRWRGAGAGAGVVPAPCGRGLGGGMHPKRLSHAGGGQAALQIPHRHRAVSVSRRRRSRIDGKPAALPVLSAVASKAFRLCNISAKECFIGNAGFSPLSAMQRSVATRTRVRGNKVSTPPTFSV